MKPVKPFALTLLFLLPAFFCGLKTVAQTQNTTAIHVTGKMNIVSKTETGITMYINGDFVASGTPTVILDGNVLLVQNFINNVSGDNVFTAESTGSFEFKGVRPQYIRGTADKEKNYINFPTLVINNHTPIEDTRYDTCAVFLNVDMGAQIKNLDIQRGRFILQSNVDVNQQDKWLGLSVNESVTMPEGNRHTGLHQRGLLQVDLNLHPEIATERRVIGFTPPFRKIYSDYFLFHLVTEPFGDNPLGGKVPLFPPKSEMLPGKGYLIGLGVIPINVYVNEMSPAYKAANPNDRITDCISLARDFAPISLTQFVNSDGKITDNFTAETLNITDVQVEINKGWNYLGNPFTVPIDLKDIIDDNPSNLSEWGLNANDIEHSFHLIKEGVATFDNNNSMDNPAAYTFEFTTEVVNKDGSSGTNPSTIIPPMQMFIIKKVSEGTKTLTIPESRRTHSLSGFTRSIVATDYIPENELLLEVKDSESITNDRVVIAFRSGAVAESRNTEDASKLFNSTRGNSQLYTLSSDGNHLASNILPPGVSEVALYLRPAIQPRHVTLTASRLESLTGLQSIILVDNVTETQTDLKRTPTYTFTTQPGDREDRFVLRFSGELQPIDDPDGVSGYYRDGRLEINGLNESHRGGQLNLYDTQGRALHQSRIQNAPTETIYVNLPQGVYIVNIAGDRFSLSAQ